MDFNVGSPGESSEELFAAAGGAAHGLQAIRTIYAWIQRRSSQRRETGAAPRRLAQVRARPLDRDARESGWPWTGTRQQLTLSLPATSPGSG